MGSPRFGINRNFCKLNVVHLLLHVRQYHCVVGVMYRITLYHLNEYQYIASMHYRNRCTIMHKAVGINQ